MITERKIMSVLRLHWIGDLEKDLRFPATMTWKIADIYRPKTIEFPKNLELIINGRIDAPTFNTFNLET